MNTKPQELSLVECIIVDDDEMSRATLVQMVKQIGHLNIAGSFGNPIEAIKFLQNNTVNLIFLDMEMPEMSGMDLINSIEFKGNIILTTSHKKYAIDAFDMNVVDYLMKPVALPRLLKAVGKIRHSTDNLITRVEKGENDYFFIKKDSVLDKVLASDILWIEALGDYIAVHTTGKKYILHLTMKSLEGKLPAAKFVRVHRSYIVNTANIRAVEDTSIFITDVPIPVGAIYKENFLSKLHLLV